MHVLERADVLFFEGGNLRSESIGRYLDALVSVQGQQG